MVRVWAEKRDRCTTASLDPKSEGLKVTGKVGQHRDTLKFEWFARDVLGKSF